MTGRSSEILLEAAVAGELHHAILLHGPSMPALESLAASVAKAVNCVNRTGGDDCASCRRTDGGTHPDVHRIGVAENRTQINVQQARAIVEEASRRPYEGRMKVFVIVPADAMNLSAANSLLKTLEEPSGATLFLLLTRSPDRLPITVRSRAQSIYVGSEGEPTRAVAESAALPVESVRLRAREAVEAGVEPDAAESLAREIYEAVADFASHRETAALLQIAARVGGRSAASDLAILAATLRDLAVIAPGDSIDADRLDIVRRSIAPSQLLRAAHRTVEAMNRLEVNADPRLLVEKAILELA